MKVGDGGSEAIETQLLGSTEGLEVVVRSEPEISGQQDMTADLMRLMGKAINIWAHRHGLSKLPPDIIFDQAVFALNEIHRLSVEQSNRNG